MRYIKRARRVNDGITWGEGTPQNLFACEVRQFLAIIDDELARSYDFGLELDTEDVLIEKWAVILSLSSLGSTMHYTDFYSFEYVHRELGNRLYAALQPQVDKYFERLKAKGMVSNMYNCHIDSVCTAIVKAIYDKRISYSK